MFITSSVKIIKISFARKTPVWAGICKDGANISIIDLKFILNAWRVAIEEWLNRF